MQKKFPSMHQNALTALPKFARLMAISIAIVLSTHITKAQSQLLKDINTTEDLDQNEFRSLTNGYNKIYFISRGVELWKTTGNEGGTVRLKTFKTIRSLTLVNSTVYFAADDGSGMELWKSSGTSGSTVKVKEFVEGLNGGTPEFLTNVNGILYFVAYTTAYGKELWKSDGTEAGTVLVKDILKIKGSSNPSGLTNVNGTLFFSANDGKNGYEIWKSDGTADGTQIVVDVRAGDRLSSHPKFLTNVNGTLFFVASDGISGSELWKTDGTAASSIRVKDIRSGSGSPFINNMTAVNNTLFFTANDGINGVEPWKSDGSEAGTMLVKDTSPGPSSPEAGWYTHPIGNFTSVFGSLYFTAYDKDNVYWIWKSDGTEAGTVPLQVAFHGSSMPHPHFVSKGDYIYYFNGVDDDFGYNQFHLYRMNANGSNPTVIATFFKYETSYDPELLLFQNTLFFNGRRNEMEGFKLFRSDGSPGSMILIKDVHRSTLGSYPAPIVKTGNGKVFIAAVENRYYNPTALWTTDGTPTGTIRLKDLMRSNTLVATDANVFFMNDGQELWRSDGTAAGTVLVKSDPALWNAWRFVAGDELVYFQTGDYRAWRTDGTEAGTFPLPVNDFMRLPTAAGNLLYFFIQRSGSKELWISNGTAVGTLKIYTFYPKKSPNYTPVAVDGDILYFVADDGISGNEVWRSDGTSAGTYQLADLNLTDSRGSTYVEDDISSLGIWNDHLYIGAFDDTEQWTLYKSNGTKGNAVKVTDLSNSVQKMIPIGNHLHFFSSLTEDYWTVSHWVTDGTAGGTELISPGRYFSADADFTIVNDILYYKSGPEIWRSDIWRSDGTACGSFVIDPGIDVFGQLEDSGNFLIFSALNGSLGVEPYAFSLSNVPQSPCATALMTTAKGNTESVSASQQEGITAPYPNPFKNDFSFRFTGSEKDIIQVSVYTSTGFPVETFNDLKPNTDYYFGTRWPVGLYVLKINTSGKLATKKVIKN